jgi:glyoxylase I family protein
VVIRAKDIAAMLTFYRDVLGCGLAKHNPAIGLYHLQVGPTMIDLIDLKGPSAGRGGADPEGRPNVDHVCIRVDPFDETAIRAHLSAHGFESEEAKTRFGAEGDGPSIYLHDPEGNGVELKGVKR